MAKVVSEKISASVLAFERKLDCSDGLFFSGKWTDREKADGWSKIGINEKAVRGTISNRLSAKDSDPAKLDAKIETPNLQTVDYVALTGDHDTLKVSFTVRVISGTGVPSACNSVLYKKKLQEIVDNYVKEYQYADLALRYAYNLANGRFLWRNRMGAESILVKISTFSEGKPQKTWTFDALDLSMKNFTMDKKIQQDIAAVQKIIQQGLLGEQYTLLYVEAFVRLGAGQEVFPSQELVLNKNSSSRGEKSKTLYATQNTAAFHSQKIGNAIRTIDTWYTDNAEFPIAVEPYGSVTPLGTAFRQPKQGRDFYSLLDGWMEKDKVPSVEDQHFLIANLIRGGVFGKSEDK